MGNKFNPLACRICGRIQGDLPWGEDGESPTYEICDCCGAESGYEDCTLETIQSYRQRWLAGGAIWFEPKEKPPNWSLEEQIKNIYLENEP